MIRKECRRGVGHSIVGLSDVRHVYAVAVPTGGTFEEQVRGALDMIGRTMEREGAAGSVVQQTVFLADKGRTDDCRRLMRGFYGSQLPAITYVPQRPCDGALLAVEALGLGGGEVQIERRSEQIVITRHNGVTWTHVGHVTPDLEAAGVYARSMSAFRKMRELLRSAGVGFDRVARTWLYLGGIVDDEGEVQRYKELNRARTDFYEGIRFAAGHLAPGIKGEVYPASTGIGADDRDILMSCAAVNTLRDDLLVLPLENPVQTSAFAYDAHYSPKSPKFARALAVTTGRFATIFVSGTASITKSESRHDGDAAAQTHQTLDNIEALISEGNFCGHGMTGLGATLADLALVRVYVKRIEDFDQTRAACEARLGDVPTIYTAADVCRPELLVEIEGMAFTHRAVCGMKPSPP